MAEQEEIEIHEVHCDNEERMLIAWGVHEPVAFLKACDAHEEGVSTFGEVNHDAWIHVSKGRHKGCWEPVQGEPNATWCYAYFAGVEEDGDEVFLPIPTHCEAWTCYRGGDKAPLSLNALGFMECTRCRTSWGRAASPAE